MKKILMALLPMTAIAEPDPWFDLTPGEGMVETISCEESRDDCNYIIRELSEYQSILNFNFAKKRLPGIGANVPESVAGAIESAANAMGDVSYVHVAITHKGTTYEYMFNRKTGWNSFRAIKANKCELKCIHKLEKQSE